MAEPFVAPDPFAAGLFPLCPTTHDQGIRWLFDIATLLVMLDCRPGDRVLDLGAGSGFSSEMLARFGYHVFAVDPDAAALQNNRRRPSFDASRIQGRVTVAQGTAEQLPFADGTFDGVVAMNVLHHVPDLERALLELGRVLRPGSRLVLSEPGLDHLTSAETQRAIVEHGENDRAFDVIAFLRLARTRGFEQAMLTATLYPALRMLQIEQLDLYLAGSHPHPRMNPHGVINELRRRHPFAVIVKEGERPKTSRHPGRLAAELNITGLPQQARAGETIDVTARATNSGDTVWLSRPSALGGYVTAGCKLRTAQGRLVADNLGRTCLPHDVDPGKSADVRLTIDLPDQLPSGQYLLEFDMVNELVCWFSDTGSNPGVRADIVVE